MAVSQLRLSCPLQYCLLNTSVLEIDVKDSSAAIAQACRLACILYLAEIRRLLGVIGMTSTLQTRKLRSFLEMSDGKWEGLELLRMWCLALGAIESTGPLRVWFVGEMKRIMEQLGLESLDEAEGELRELLWFDDVHSPLFHDLHSGGMSSIGKSGVLLLSS
jgi:hypothetical protein